jgi:multidrug transporter EmrE-like cation transporter
MKLNSSALHYGVLLALLDVVTFPFVKLVSLGSLSTGWMFLPILLYSIGPVLLLKSLQVEGLAVINFLWDLISSVLITILGIYVFKEKINRVKALGIFLSFICIMLLSYEE